MIIGSVCENKASEKRISVTPENVKKFISNGFKVYLEESYGTHLDIDDQRFLENGAELFSNKEKILKDSDILLQLNLPCEKDLKNLSPNKNLIGVFDPTNNQDSISKLSKNNINVFSLELLPRITRAQKMDALSSQANLAGYAAVIEASRTLSKSFPMMMTAAGTISPARVFVVGVGVAGLQAIATAKRLGARGEAFDTRPVVEEQVKSLGAKFVKIDIGDTEETDQGYAKELTPEQIRMQQDGMKKICSLSDVIITTAQVFGRPAPRIITQEMVDAMQPGSVIVDMAVATGGNVEGSKNDEYVFDNGVTIIGMSNLPGEVARDASQVFGNNIFNMIEEFWDVENKSLNFDLEDEILKGCVITHQGKVVNEAIK